jgi:hypothetical protein
MEEFTVLLVMVELPLIEAWVDPGKIPLDSSSISFNFTIHFPSCLCLSSSYILDSEMVNILFLLTKLLVPGLPENSQLIPFQCYLKLLWMCFNLSKADISEGFLAG